MVTRHRPVYLFLGSCCLLYFGFIVLSDRRVVEDESLESVLWTTALPPTAILIDTTVLKRILDRKDTAPQELKNLKIAVEEDANVKPADYPQFDIVFYDSTVSEDYVLFEDDVKRGMPRSALSPQWFGRLAIPGDIALFLSLWERSEILECRHVQMGRNSSAPPRISPSVVPSLAAWRDELYSIRTIPHMCGGTLLGWYRECGIIPHTLDMDFATSIEYFNEVRYEKKMRKMKTANIRQRIGMPADSLELKFNVFHGRGGSTAVDLFYLYSDGQRSWVAGTDQSGARFRYYYPRIERYCSAILHDHIFVVPCNVEQLLEIEYGPGWRGDHPTAKFYWFKSHRNVERVGKYSKEEMKRAYVRY